MGFGLNQVLFQLKIKLSKVSGKLLLYLFSFVNARRMSVDMGRRGRDEWMKGFAGYFIPRFPLPIYVKISVPIRVGVKLCRSEAKFNICIHLVCRRNTTVYLITGDCLTDD